MQTASQEMSQYLPIELRLLLLLVRGHLSIEAQAEIRALLEQPIDWDQFIYLAKEHRLYPVVAFQVNQLGASILPESVLAVMQQLAMRNTLQMLQLTAVMEKVSHVFAQAQIPALVLKGPVLAESIYGEYSLRTSKDIDLLVHEDSLEQAEELLKSIGFELDEKLPRILNAVKRKKYHLSYIHPHYRVQVELHWRMSLDTFREPAFNELWERRRVTVKTNMPVYYLSQEDLFVYLAAHGARHGWFRLRWLVDIERMVQTGMDWEIVVRYSGQLDRKHIIGQALYLVSQLFQVPVPLQCRSFADSIRSRQLSDEALNILNEYIFLMNDQSPNETKAYFKRYQSLLLTTRQQWKRNLSKLYPDYVDAEILMLPKWLHFMYFPLRPFLWYWYKRKKRIAMQQ